MVLAEFREWLERNLPLHGIALAFVIGVIFLSLGAIIHELGHVLTARALSCGAVIVHTGIFTGVTGVEEVCPPNKLVIIALAGPIFAMLFALWCWFSGKDVLTRVLGMLMMFYSVIPSLFPVLEGSDMFKAVEYGLNPNLGMLIWIFVFGWFLYQVIREVTEKEKPFG